MQVEMLPGGDRAVTNRFDQFRPALLVFLRSKLLWEIESQGCPFTLADADTGTQR